MTSILLIGYSGHAYVVCDVLASQNQKIIGYCDGEEKVMNPFNLRYFGSENSEHGKTILRSNDYFVAIGDNKTRKKVIENLLQNGFQNPINAIHKQSIVSKFSSIGYGALISAGAIINVLAEIGNGVICNTNCVIEHECVISDFVHIAPSAVLCGNVRVGENTFIGANSVVKQGIKIGKNVIVGAGSVVIRDIPDNVTVAGNPAKIIKNHN